MSLHELAASVNIAFSRRCHYTSSTISKSIPILLMAGTNSAQSAFLACSVPGALSAKECLCLVVLTACRSGEARGATWDEVDLESREWRIPASRMKAATEHRFPLSDAALTVVEAVRPMRDSSNLLFPSPLRPSRPLADMALTKVLHDTGLADRATVHGFRTSFRTWASERTSVPHAVAEMALAHAVGTSVERSYARSGLFDKRRGLMEQWAQYVLGRGAKVVGLRR